MSKFWYLGILIFCISSCFPMRYIPYNKTNEKFENLYASMVGANEKIVHTWYHYVTTTNEKGEFVVRTFFPEKKQMTSLTTYKSQTERIKNGFSQEWYDNGNRKCEGTYLNDKAEGIWKYYYHDTETLASQGKYKENEKEGKWESFDDKGRLKERLNYQAGLREGRFVQYDSLSNVINEGIYKADTIFEQTNNSETAENTLPILSSCATVNLEERQECFHKTLFKHLGRVVRYPSVAREYGVEGTAYVRFTINEDGTMSDIEVMSGLCASIAKECKRVIKTLPEWSPGLQNGKRVKVGYTLPFKFKLE